MDEDAAFPSPCFLSAHQTHSSSSPHVPPSHPAHSCSILPRSAWAPRSPSTCPLVIMNHKPSTSDKTQCVGSPPHFYPKCILTILGMLADICLVSRLCIIIWHSGIFLKHTTMSSIKVSSPQLFSKSQNGRDGTCSQYPPEFLVHRHSLDSYCLITVWITRILNTQKGTIRFPSLLL